MLYTVDSPCHAQGVEPYLWLDPQTPRHDGTVEHGIVCQHTRVSPVILSKELTQLAVCTREPLGSLIVFLYPDPNHLEPGVTHVFFRGDLRQAVVLCVVGLKVYRDQVHHASAEIGVSRWS